MFGILIFVGLFLFLYVALMSLYAIGWKKLPEWASTNPPREKYRQAGDAARKITDNNLESQFGLFPKTKVSIIIPARNEAANIGKCLGSVLQNNYPKDLVEIIVVDDFSTDKTAEIAKKLLAEHGGKVLRLQDYLSSQERLNAYKKKALEIAINHSAGELIITTDADCICPPQWIQELVSVYEQKKAKFIVAPVSFIPATKKTGLYYFQSLDFMTMQGITAAGTKLHIGSMCNGANLAFSREAFDAVGGYRGIDHIASGDDMLLLHKIKKQFPNSIHYLKSRKAIVETPCQPTIRDFFNQRIRWASKSDKYEDKLLIAILGVVYLFNLSLPALLVASFFTTDSSVGLFLLLEAFVFKIVIELFFLMPVAGFYQKRQELLWFPLLQPLHIFYIISAGFLGKFGTYQWKGRQTR